MRWIATLISVSMFLAPAQSAEPASEPETLMTVRGTLLMSEDFAKPTEVSNTSAFASLKTGWRLRPGKWEFVDAALKGTQLAADNHSARASYRLRFQDAVIQFDVQLGSCRRAVFMVINGKSEHVSRVNIDKDGFSAQKDDRDHEGPDMPEPFGTVKLPIQSKEWKTVLLEFRGDEMVATIDGQSIAGAHSCIGAEKAFISYAVTGVDRSASFRNLRVWEALPNRDWPANKARLQAPAKTPAPP
jgi:hypothetical protein